MMVEFPARDYVSPQFERISLDFAFPNLTVGDTRLNIWPYLRSEVPHNWYVDRREGRTGFLNRDEAHLVYNNGLQFRGRKALEIGCWMGWSAAHLAMAGVELDIIDPALGSRGVRESVTFSLGEVSRKYDLRNRVSLRPSRSPKKVEEMGGQGARWSLIFIDGDHDGSAPRDDAMACERYAEPDAMMMFHDLVAPSVGAGLDYLRDRGWNTLVYQTMQIMGVAWRGNVTPVAHRPDPAVLWELPDHLQGYTVSAG